LEREIMGEGEQDPTFDMIYDNNKGDEKEISRGGGGG